MYVRSQAIEIVEDWKYFPARLRKGALSIGNFDGVHVGHQSLLRTLTDWARERARPSIAFTFDPHPLTLLRPERAPQPLTTLSRRAELLGMAGIDVMVVCPVSQDLLNLEYHQFFEQVILESIAPEKIVEGPNFFFGRNRLGNMDRLIELCRPNGIQVEVKRAEQIGQEMVSSSLIRRWLASGKMLEVQEALGSMYRLNGRVVAGDGRGRGLGFPTANLTDIATMLPADGVYACLGWVNGLSYPAAVHIGEPVTFAITNRRVEVHLLGLNQNLYGRRLDLDFGPRLRGIEKFESKAQLVHQIQQDVAKVRHWATGSCPGNGTGLGSE